MNIEADPNEIFFSKIFFTNVCWSSYKSQGFRQAAYSCFTLREDAAVPAENGIFAPFIENERFAKTGSGQT
jgi:hypothetical protein